MENIAKQFYPPFACAKAYKDQFMEAMLEPMVVPSVNTIAPSYIEGVNSKMILDTSLIDVPKDRPKTKKNKKQKRLTSRGESGKSAKSRSVYKGSSDAKVSNDVTTDNSHGKLSNDITTDNIHEEMMQLKNEAGI